MKAFLGSGMTVRQATIQRATCGVCPSSEARPTIEDVDVSGPSAIPNAGGAAIDLFRAMGASVSRVRLHDLQGLHGLDEGGGTTAVIRFAEVTGGATGLFSDSPTGIELSESKFRGNELGLRLAAPQVVFHNDIFGNGLQVLATPPMELSDSRVGSPTLGHGNYWGRGCPAALFVPGTDSSDLGVVDSHPFAQESAWTRGDAPGCALTPPQIRTPAEGSLLGTLRPTFMGTAAPLSLVTIREGTSVLATGNATADGSFVMTAASNLAQGNHTVVATSAWGNQSSSASASRSFRIDSQPPLAPVILTPKDGATVSGAFFLVTGRATAGVRVSLQTGTAVLGTAFADSGGAFVVAAVFPAGAETVSFVAIASDAAGNESLPSGSLTVRKPAQTTLTGQKKKLKLTKIEEKPNPFAPSLGQRLGLRIEGEVRLSQGTGNGKKSYTLMIRRRFLDPLTRQEVASTYTTTTIAPPAKGDLASLVAETFWDGRVSTGGAGGDVPPGDVLVETGLSVEETRTCSDDGASCVVASSCCSRQCNGGQCGIPQPDAGTPADAGKPGKPKKDGGTPGPDGGPDAGAPDTGATNPPDCQASGSSTSGPCVVDRLTWESVVVVFEPSIIPETASSFQAQSASELLTVLRSLEDQLAVLKKNGRQGASVAEYEAGRDWMISRYEEVGRQLYARMAEGDHPLPAASRDPATQQRLAGLALKIHDDTASDADYSALLNTSRSVGWQPMPAGESFKQACPSGNGRPHASAEALWDRYQGHLEVQWDCEKGRFASAKLSNKLARALAPVAPTQEGAVRNLLAALAPAFPGLGSATPVRKEPHGASVLWRVFRYADTLIQGDYVSMDVAPAPTGRTGFLVSQFRIRWDDDEGAIARARPKDGVLECLPPVASVVGARSWIAPPFQQFDAHVPGLAFNPSASPIGSTLLFITAKHDAGCIVPFAIPLVGPGGISTQTSGQYIVGFPSRALGGPFPLPAWPEERVGWEVEEPTVEGDPAVWGLHAAANVLGEVRTGSADQLCSTTELIETSDSGGFYSSNPVSLSCPMKTVRLALTGKNITEGCVWAPRDLRKVLPWQPLVGGRAYYNRPTGLDPLDHGLDEYREW
ncbi:MAG: hypothetical protein HY901_36485, partial [Deltaproteobacteria bacterium]|nr:hypothetical protein [Deltaproteobacteria bacterium]